MEKVKGRVPQVNGWLKRGSQFGIRHENRPLRNGLVGDLLSKMKIIVAVVVRFEK